MYLPTGQLPEQPRLDRAEQQLAALGARPRAGDLLEQPAQLRRGKISIDHEAGLLPEYLRQTARLQLVAIGTRAAALPDDRVVDRLSRRLIPDDGGLALVRDADPGDLGRRRADALHRLDRNAQHRRPDLVRIVLDPAGLRKILMKFTLRHAANAAVPVEQDAAVRGRPRVKRHNISFHIFCSDPVSVSAKGKPLSTTFFRKAKVSASPLSLSMVRT